MVSFQPRPNCPNRFIEGGRKGVSVFLVVFGCQREFRLEHVPEIVDVVVVAPAVSNEGVESGIEIVEQGSAGEVAWQFSVGTERIGEGGDDLSPVRVRNAFVEEPEYREGIDIGGGPSSSSLGNLHIDALVRCLQLGDQGVAIVFVWQ